MKSTYLKFGNDRISDKKENLSLVEKFYGSSLPELLTWNDLIPIVGKINSLVPKNRQTEGIRNNMNHFAVNYLIGETWEKILEFIHENN